VIQQLKEHFSKSYNLVFWLFFGPAIIWTLLGVYDLYTIYFNELTQQDHLQFFLRFFFPISVGLLVTALETRQRLRRQALVKGIEKYLKN
jgi:hypothetical protein